MRDPTTSPAAALFDHIGNAIANIAPERAAEVAALVDGVAFSFNDEPGLAFEAWSVDRMVRVPIRGVEFLWVQSYAMWIVQSLHRAQDLGAIAIDASKEPRARWMPELLLWANKNEFGPTPVPWPSNAPRPTTHAARSSNPSDERVATEIALCAIAWILHHELAHVDKGHIGISPTAIQDEAEADRAATAWILDAAPAGYPTLKRGLGIAVATATIAAIELHAGSSFTPRDHPHPADRIDRAFRHPAIDGEDAVHHAAAVLLSMHLAAAACPLDPSNEYETSQEYLAEACRVLKRVVP